jgi:lysylphosphatidylglycerol synthetase-like protein (DUF2156 family)
LETHDEPLSAADHSGLGSIFWVAVELLFVVSEALLFSETMAPKPEGASPEVASAETAQRKSACLRKVVTFMQQALRLLAPATIRPDGLNGL